MSTTKINRPICEAQCVFGGHPSGKSVRGVFFRFKGLFKKLNPAPFQSHFFLNKVGPTSHPYTSNAKGGRRGEREGVGILCGAEGGDPGAP